jgi:hypothetical protein
VHNDCATLEIKEAKDGPRVEMADGSQEIPLAQSLFLRLEFYLSSLQDAPKSAIPA